MPRKSVIIVAGGTGTRMGTSTAKQFLELSGKPIILHSIEAFLKHDPSILIILALFPALKESWQKMMNDYSLNAEVILVDGGEERFHSVKNGLAALENQDCDLVAIHDAVRPLVSQETISNCFAAAAEKGGAIPVIPVVDTIRRETDKGAFNIPRYELSAVQTPQCFRFQEIFNAYQTEYRQEFTDDASVYEFTGNRIQTVPGNRTNLKITTPEDLLIAEAFISSGL